MIVQTTTDCYHDAHPDSKIEALYTSIVDGCYAFSEGLFNTAEHQERWRWEHHGPYSFIDTVFWSETRERRFEHRYEFNLKLVEDLNRRREGRLNRKSCLDLMFTNNEYPIYSYDNGR